MLMVLAIMAAQNLMDGPPADAPVVQEHNLLVGLGVATGFYAKSLTVKSANIDVSGIDFSGAAASPVLSLGYGYYGLDPFRARVRGTVGTNLMSLHWAGTGNTLFEQDSSGKETLIFDHHLGPVFGVGGEVEYRWKDLVVDAGVDWHAASNHLANKFQGNFGFPDEEHLRYGLLNYTLTAGWQATEVVKLYGGLRYSDFEMTYRQTASHVTVSIPPPPALPIFTPNTDHAKIDLGFKHNLNYVAGVALGVFTLEGWLGSGLYGGTIGFNLSF